MDTDHSDCWETSSMTKEVRKLHASTCHLPTLIRTTAAFFRTTFAVFNLVLFALGTASIADFGTQTAKVSRKL
tara:strand:- start:715 stop:933 length:219 start_codon:yes stop_codon:yes gene_type:complete